MITSTPQTSRCLVCFYYKCFMIVDLVVWFNCCFWYLSLGLLDYCKIIITTILVSYFWRSWLFNTTGLLSARPVITCLLNFWEKKRSSIRGLTVSCVFGSICTIYLRPALGTLHTVSTVKSWTDALLAKLYQVLQMPPRAWRLFLSALPTYVHGEFVCASMRLLCDISLSNC